MSELVGGTERELNEMWELCTTAGCFNLVVLKSARVLGSSMGKDMCEVKKQGIPCVKVNMYTYVYVLLRVCAYVHVCARLCACVSVSM